MPAFKHGIAATNKNKTGQPDTITGFEARRNLASEQGAFISGISIVSAGRRITKDKETSVFPAHAVIHKPVDEVNSQWIPAFAGKTVRLIDANDECTLLHTLKIRLTLLLVFLCQLPFHLIQAPE